MEIADHDGQLVGTPELAPIGKRIEMLRIECGLSKQQLAKAAGISRQQLWRVLAGKSDLTSSLRERLAFVLRADVAVLQAAASEDQLPATSLSTWFTSVRTASPGAPVPRDAIDAVAAVPAPTFAEFVATPARVQALLSTLPGCDAGLALKRSVLDAIEDVAMARGIALPGDFFELRRAVITRAL
jgi:transcriptional regulator with XRE-family HTH domain